MRFAYADPPYVGQANRHYGCAEIDHSSLLDELRAGRYDGWAISASAPSLFMLLREIRFPEGSRIGAWVKPFCAFKRGVRPCYAWEPVIFWGGRNPPRIKHPPPIKGGSQTTPKDFSLLAKLSELENPAIAESITLKRGLTGAKPERFCYWVFDLLGAQQGDELVDLFPGTGAVSSAWDKYLARVEP